MRGAMSIFPRQRYARMICIPLQHVAAEAANCADQSIPRRLAL